MEECLVSINRELVLTCSIWKVSWHGTIWIKLTWLFHNQRSQSASHSYHTGNNRNTSTILAKYTPNIHPISCFTTQLDLQSCLAERWDVPDVDRSHQVVDSVQFLLSMTAKTAFLVFHLSVVGVFNTSAQPQTTACFTWTSLHISRNWKHLWG